MPPNGRRWQVLTWSWACTTGHPASDQVLEAANAAWPYAQLCAWTYLNDEDTAHELMDYAIQNATEYIGRHPSATPAKLGARIKSRIRRQAHWLANRQKRERWARVGEGTTLGRLAGSSLNRQREVKGRARSRVGVAPRWR